MLIGEIAVIFRPRDASFDCFHVSPFANPCAADGWDANFAIAVKSGITPGSRGVVDAHRFIFFQRAVGQAGRGETDFAHRHPDVGAGAFEVNPV